MANSQYEDKNFPRVTPTRPKRYNNLEFLVAKYLRLLLFLAVCNGKNVVNYPFPKSGWDVEELIGGL